MKTSFRLWLLLLSWLLLTGAARAQGTAFTYQGRLNSGANAATGVFDLTFTLFNVASGAGQVGTPVSLPLTPVTNGLFTVTLDFGSQFPGANRWLEIGVRTNGGGAFTTLSPRQRITATPYAITASNISGLLPATSLAGTYSSVVTLNNAGNSFTGNGAGLTALNANNLASGTVPDARLATSVARTNQVWLRAGNLGTTAGTDFLGTRDNQALEFRVNNMRVMRFEPGGLSQGAPNVIGGSPRNFVGAVVGATIAGGGATNFLGVSQTNKVTANFGTVGGGMQNTSSGYAAAVGGGELNTSSGAYATVSGGYSNRSIALDSTVGGGSFNRSSGAHSTVGGGGANISSNTGATVGGGATNTSSGAYATVSGGRHNGGLDDYTTIGGGATNRIEFLASLATIGGGGENSILFGTGATIAGGEKHLIDSAAWSSIGGGLNNSIGLNSGDATIAGGQQNDILTNAPEAVIGGGLFNLIRTGATNGFIGGGSFNTVSGPNGAVPGGTFNNAGTNAFAAGRRARATHTGSFVWADSTDVECNTTGTNQFLVRAGGGVGVGATNLTGALFIRQPAGIPAAGMNAADNGLALGQFRTNSYKWMQSYGGSLVLNPLGNNVGVGLTNPASALHVNGTVTATSFNPPSDRNLKENFTGVSPREVLEKVSALKITRWNFKGDEAVPHLGPMAQDFHAAFQLGTDDRHIATVDADGVALAAIQGLNQKVESEKRKAEKEREQLRAENAELKARLEKLEQLLIEKAGGAR